MSLDGDIIHPRNQGIGVAAEFIERWADRKARRVVVDKPDGRRLKALENDAALVRRFRALHAQGFTIKRMAAELNIGTTSVSRLIARLEVKSRKRKDVTGDAAYVEVKFRVTWDEFCQLKSRCGRGEKSMAHFVRAAVRYKMEGLI